MVVHHERGLHVDSVARRLRDFGARNHGYVHATADGVLIVDAKPDNFIRTESDIVPIDLQMAITDPRNRRSHYRRSRERIADGNLLANRRPAC